MAHCTAAREVMQLFILKPGLRVTFLQPVPARTVHGRPVTNCSPQQCGMVYLSTSTQRHEVQPFISNHTPCETSREHWSSVTQVLSLAWEKNSGGGNSLAMNCAHYLFVHVVCIVSAPDSLKELCKSGNTQTHSQKHSLRSAISPFAGQFLVVGCVGCFYYNSVYYPGN